MFDGGAPALKRRTVGRRRERREGRREDAVRTAGKLLAVQMQRRMREEEEEQANAKEKEKEKVRRGKGGGQVGGGEEEEEALPENLVYVEELQMTPEERQRKRQNKFRKKDAYHLPELDTPLAEMGAPNDPRIMSMEELQTYARQFDSGEDINVYDFSKINFDSPFFQSLPDSDRYNILNAARLRSRLRMGYSKDQLDTMFPDRMAFSKFQIDRVRERNELTQRLMNINGMNGDDATIFGFNNGGRVAGEKGREYVLVKNDGVEGGWALGVVDSKDEGKARDKPIDVDELHKRKYADEVNDDGEGIAGNGEEEDDFFEDIPVAGLNRLPKRPATLQPSPRGRLPRSKQIPRSFAENRREIDASSRQQAGHAGMTSSGKVLADEASEKAEDSLFFAEGSADSEMWEDVQIGGIEAGDNQKIGMSGEDAQLQQATQMSLQQDDIDAEARLPEDSNEGYGDVDNANSRSISHESNHHRLKNKNAIVNDDDDDNDDDGFNLHAALSEARKTKRKSVNKELMIPSATSTATINTQAILAPSNIVAQRAGFDGPLPFEKLNLGTSLLGKKKMQKFTEELEGGFEREPLPSELKTQENDKKETAPLPPWFAGGDAMKPVNDKSLEKLGIPKDENMKQNVERLGNDTDIGDVHDNESSVRDKREHLDMKEMANKTVGEQMDVVDSPQSDEFVDVDMVKEESRTVSVEPHITGPERVAKDESVSVVNDLQKITRGYALERDIDDNNVAKEIKKNTTSSNNGNDFDDGEAEALEWEESDQEDRSLLHNVSDTKANTFNGIRKLSWAEKQNVMKTCSNEAITDGKDIAVEPKEVVNERKMNDSPNELPYNSGFANQQQDSVANEFDNQIFNVEDDEEDIISDPEEEELIRQLANEADEHERFAATLNNQLPSTLVQQQQQQPPPDFDKELKALRNQQKKDRRDADEITQTMITECQQLLSLFGLPYITAPMEAEAQCSRLVELGLVDGIVTDDSDIFLFGGNRVYKNMFNQAKFVECYLLPDITAELGLDRHKLIAIAHLLGSDYTEGLPGIGPVTAVELLSEFNDLTTFREWYAAVQQGLRPKSEDSGHPFRRKFRRNATKLFLPPSFPDPVVDDAYINPVVDNDTQPFEWGVPDLAALRSFLSGTVGWSEERTDEILVPVIRDMNRREAEGTQANLTRFFSGGVGAGAFAPRRRGFVDEGHGQGQSRGSRLVQGQLGGSNSGVGSLGRSKRLDTALGKIAGRAKGTFSDGDGNAANNSNTVNGNKNGSTGPESGLEDHDLDEGRISVGEDKDTPPPSKKKRTSKGVNKDSNGKSKSKSKKRKIVAGSG